MSIRSRVADEAFVANITKDMPDLGREVKDFKVYTWKLDNLKNLDIRATSPKFECGGQLWRIVLYPFGNQLVRLKDHLSVYLEYVGQAGNIYAQFTLTVSNPNDSTIYHVSGAAHRFVEDECLWGFAHFREHSKLYSKQEGNARPIIENDSAEITAFVRVLEDSGGLNDVEKRTSIRDHEVFVAKHMPHLGNQVKDFKVYTWKLDDWKKLEKKLTSPEFECGGHRWHIVLYPSGNPALWEEDVVSVYLEYAGETWNAYAQFAIAISNPDDPTIYRVFNANHRFTANESLWGFLRFGEPTKMYNVQGGNSRPILENDSAEINVFVRVLEDSDGSQNVSTPKDGIETYSSIEKFTYSEIVLMKVEERISIRDYEAFAAKHMPKLVHQVKDFKVYTWRVYNWRTLEKKIFSPEFECGGQQWHIVLHPFGNPAAKLNDNVSVYLECVSTEIRNVYAHFALSISNPDDPTINYVLNTARRFNGKNRLWGFTPFRELSKLLNVNGHARPIIQNDSAEISAFVRVLEDPMDVPEEIRKSDNDAYVMNILSHSAADRRERLVNVAFKNLGNDIVIVKTFLNDATKPQHEFFVEPGSVIMREFDCTKWYNIHCIHGREKVVIVKIFNRANIVVDVNYAIQ